MLEAGEDDMRAIDEQFIYQRASIAHMRLERPYDTRGPTLRYHVCVMFRDTSRDDTSRANVERWDGSMWQQVHTVWLEQFEKPGERAEQKELLNKTVKETVVQLRKVAYQIMSIEELLEQEQPA